jgi:hypothetical protein
MSNSKRSTIPTDELESVAAAAVKRALEARGQAGVELSGEQLNSISGGASFYLKDPFIYGIKIDPYWFRSVGGVAVNPVQVGGIASKVGG